MELTQKVVDQVNKNLMMSGDYEKPPFAIEGENLTYTFRAPEGFGTGGPVAYTIGVGRREQLREYGLDPDKGTTEHAEVKWTEEKTGGYAYSKFVIALEDVDAEELAASSRRIRNQPKHDKVDMSEIVPTQSAAKRTV